MNEKTYFAVVVPLSKAERQMTQDRKASQVLRQIVWSRTAERLKSLLGKTCSQFFPSMLPYGEPLFLPYGVVLGSVDPMPFLLCYMRARERQEQEIGARTEKIRSQGNVVFQEQVDKDRSISVTAYRSNDPSLKSYMETAQRFFSNDITAAAGLYYLGLDVNYVSKQQEQRILADLSAYALCVAELQPLEGCG